MRNHLPVPNIDADSYELEIDVEGTDQTKMFTLKDIQALPKYNVTAAIMCGGNRRSEMSHVKPVKGLSWGSAAIGNAVWSGPRLCDILREMGISSDEKRHVQVSKYFTIYTMVNGRYSIEIFSQVRRLRYGSYINTICSIYSIVKSM